MTLMRGFSGTLRCTTTTPLLIWAVISGGHSHNHQPDRRAKVMSTKYRNSRDVPLDIIIARLNDLSDAVTGGRESQEREFTMRIPAECDRDADLVIGEAASRLAKLHAENEALRARVAVQFDALTSIAVALKGAGNLTKEMHDFIVAATDGDSEAILLRKQAEAVE